MALSPGTVTINPTTGAASGTGYALALYSAAGAAMTDPLATALASAAATLPDQLPQIRGATIAGRQAYAPGGGTVIGVVT